MGNPAPQSLADLKAQIIAELIPEVVAAVEAMIATATLTSPGRLIAGTISSSGSALVFNGAGQPYIAMVSLNGAATLTSCYVPAHLAATIAAGQEVFVEAINGNGADLQIHSIRNLAGPIAASFPALTANSLVIGGVFSAGAATLTSLAISGTLSAGATTLASATITNNATVGGTFSAGATTLTSANVTNNATVGGTLGAGATTLASLSVTGNGTVTGTFHAGASTLASAVVSGTFSSGAATLTSASITGNATVGGTLHAGASTLGNTVVGGTFGSDNGWISTDGSGNMDLVSVTLSNGGALTGSNGGSLTGISAFTGAGNGTFSHGLTATPNAFAAMANANNISASSEVVAFFGPGSTTVSIIIGGGAGFGWNAIAIKS